MRVFALGGTGRVGRSVAKVLAQGTEVSEVAIAARDVAVAKRVSAEIGPKAAAVEVDATDEAGLVRIVGGYDLVVNTAGPDFRVALPAIRAAIAAGTHYCDISADGPSVEKALSLDQEAKKAGVTAVTGIGHTPGSSNLLMLHASNQLDAAETLRWCTWWGMSPETYRLWGDPEEMRTSGRVNASWQTIMAWLAGPGWTYRGGKRVDVNPYEQATEISLPGGAGVTAYPVASTEPVTLPRHVPGVRTVEVLLALDPPQLNDLLLKHAHRVAAGETDADEAVLAFLETIARDPSRWLGGPRKVPPGYGSVASAAGWKGDRRVRYSCWPASGWESTTGPLATTAWKILRGEIREQGVLPPEAVLDPIPFLLEASRYGRDPPRAGQLLHESLEEEDETPESSSEGLAS